MKNEFSILIPNEDLKNQSVKDFLIRQNRPFQADENELQLYFDNYQDMEQTYDKYIELLATIIELENIYCNNM